MGKTNKAAVDLSKSYVGECQCCFRFQVTKGKEQLGMVLHGYERPGDGWIEGRCWGVGELPFELSCERTKEWRENVKKALKTMKKTIADIRANRIEKFFHQIVDEAQTTKNRQFGNYKTAYKTVEVTRGWVHPDAPRYSGTFESVRQQHLANAEMRERQMKSTLEFLDQKIASWKYAPEALVEHETWVREQARKTEAERDAVKNDRRLAKLGKAFNLAFRYIGTAVNKHRAGYRNTTTFGSCYHTFEQQLEHMRQGLHVFIAVEKSIESKGKDEREMLTPEMLEEHSLPKFEAMYAAKSKKVRA
jgi:hypothetical protein